LAIVGKLPENLELFRAEAVLRRLAEEMVVKMELVDAGELTPGEAAAFFRELVGAGDAPMNGNGQVAEIGAGA
jgi:polyhydroxyalkanoate synthesis regulator phasin